jgi:hypothetical protein
MFKPPRLEKNPVSLSRLREQCEHAIISSLDSVEAEQVTLIVSSRFSSLLSQVFIRGLSVLHQYKVAEYFELSEDVTKIQCSKIIYINFASAGEVCSVMKHALKVRHQTLNGMQRLFNIFTIGVWNSLCEDILVKHGLKDFFCIKKLSMGFIPLEYDLITLGMEKCLYECYMDGNKSSLVNMADALHQLQSVYGKFSNIKYKGEMSMLVFQYFMDLNKNIPTKESKRSAGEIDTLILLDRRIDYASALCSPLTYEALLDELFQIKDGYIGVPLSIISTGNSNSSAAITEHDGETVQIPLNSNDEIFDQIRDLNIELVPIRLTAEAAHVKNSFNNFQSTSVTASAAEVHDFVKIVPQLKEKQQLLERHINLTEYIGKTTKSRSFRDQWKLERSMMDGENSFEEIKEMIFRHEPMLKVLRLMCLSSVIQDGIPKDELNKLKFHFIRTYGHEFIFTFDHLERIGLLFERNDSTFSLNSDFLTIAESLKLINLGVNAQNPDSSAHVTGGYMPLSVRIIEEILKNGNWLAIDSSLKLLHGPRSEVSLDSTHSNKSNRKKHGEQRKTRKKVMLVCFVGGVSFVEVAALRWISMFCKFYFKI